MSSPETVRLSKPWTGKEEMEAIEAVVRSGQLVQAAHVARFEELVAERCSRRHAIAVSSGTAALELALRASGLGAGDDVLCPDLTWPSPAHAILLARANPVLADVDRGDWTVSPYAIAQDLTDNTRAAIVIDQFGMPARYDELLPLLKDRVVISDAACSLGSTHAAKPCGSFGDIACMSFHPRKIITTGEGGMCLTDDDEIAKQLRTLRNHGQREPGKFAIASGNYRMTEMSGAMGIVQMRRLDAILERRRFLFARYREQLPALHWQIAKGASASNYQTAGFVLPQDARKGGRETFMASLRKRGIETALLSYALHRLQSLSKAKHATSFSASTEVADWGIAIPLFPEMTIAEQDRVIEAVQTTLNEAADE